MKYISCLKEKKAKHEKIVMLTAYDVITAKILDKIGIDVILVGDSYGMVKLGYENTLPVTMDEMLIITKAVSRGVNESIIIADMPFLSFHISNDDAVRNAGIFLKETKAQGVKIESYEGNLELIKKIIKADIPVMGHIGITPQSIYRLGGYKIQGKTAESAKKLFNLAKNLEDIGCFAIVLEGIVSEVSQKITESLKIPTIGIGAGPYCDGQVLVIDDLLGLNPDFIPKHTKRYADLYNMIRESVLNFKKDVVSGKFPEEVNYSKMAPEELKKFKGSS